MIEWVVKSYAACYSTLYVNSFISLKYSDNTNLVCFSTNNILSQNLNIGYKICPKHLYDYNKPQSKTNAHS